MFKCTAKKIVHVYLFF